MELAPRDAPCTVVDAATGDVLLRVAPIAARSDAARLAARVAKLFVARAALVEPTQRAHPGRYYSHGIARTVNDSAKLAYYGPLRTRVHFRHAKQFHQELQVQIARKLAELMGEAERAFGRDVTAELDEVASLRAAYDGDRLPTSAAFSIGLNNAYHRDRGDVKQGPLSWTTIVSIDLGAVLADDPCAYVPARRSAKAPSRAGDGAYRDEFERFVEDRYREHVEGRGGSTPPIWQFSVNRAVAVDLRGRGRGVFLRLQAGRHHHGTTLRGDSYAADLLCGLAIYSSAPVVGPMKTRRAEHYEAIANEPELGETEFVADAPEDDLPAGAEPDSASESDSSDSD